MYIFVLLLAEAIPESRRLKLFNNFGIMLDDYDPCWVFGIHYLRLLFLD